MGLMIWHLKRTNAGDDVASFLSDVADWMKGRK